MNQHRLWIALAMVICLQTSLAFAQNGIDAIDTTIDAKGMVNLDFSDVEIRDVVKAISKITNRNFVLDDRVRGKITIISPQPVTIKEAYEAFISGLEVKNFTVVTEGKINKIIPIREAKSSPIPSVGTDLPYGAGFITRLVPILYISANEIALSLKSLVSPNGSITAYGPTNSLIVTDSASNIRRLMKIISKLDRRGFQEGIEVIPLNYASANDIAKILMDLFKIGQASTKKSTPARRSSRGSQDIDGGQVISKIIPDDRTNSIVVIANREGVEKVLNVVRRLDHEIEVEEGRGRIHVHYLKHADSEEMAQTLSGLTQSNNRSPASRIPRPPNARSAQSRNNTSTNTGSLSLFEGEVKLAPDVATNSLVISASPQDYESLKPIIKKLDIRRRQVFVEAVILEVNIAKSLELGLEGTGGHAFGPNADNLLFGGTILGGLNPLSIGSADALTPAPGAPPAGGVFGLRGREITIDGFGTIPLFGALFRALQTNQVLNVLSTPNILTTDNKPAEIIVGQEIPIQTQSTLSTGGNAVSNFEREKVGIELKVTPQINESDFVTMEIEQKIDDVSGDASTISAGLATINTRQATTTVVVEDGQTVVIGGLISENVDETKSKVPILGDIPLLGWLFQNKSKSTTRTNLMIFITPTIVKDSMDLSRVTREKEVQRQRFNRRNRIEDVKGFREYGIKDRMNIDRKGPTSDRGRRIGGDRYSEGSRSVEDGTAAYVEGYVIDANDGGQAQPVSGDSADQSANPFAEIVPPTSE